MSSNVSFLDPSCNPIILPTDLKLVARYVGPLQNPDNKDQIWYLMYSNVFVQIF